MKSFFTERTAEYTLVPAFSKELSPLGKVAPIFFWKTREGNKVSEAVHNDGVRVIAFFARRPKINIQNLNSIEMKINSSLYEFSERANNLNIPVFCGLPITTNIFELDAAECLWFHIGSGYEDKHITFDIKERKCKPSSINFLTQQKIMNIVKRESVKMSWIDAMEAINHLNNSSKDIEYIGLAARFMRNTHYKLVYFLIKE